MSDFRKHLGYATSILLAAAVTVTVPAHAQGSPTPITIDQSLYTTYQVFGNSISLSVCGSTPESEGCYGGGELGPFGKIGAILVTKPVLEDTDVVARDIYVLDTAAGKTHVGVRLDVYTEKQVVSSGGFDTVTVALKKAVPLSLQGGSGTTASMAANNLFLFVGTNQSPNAIKVERSTLETTSVGGFSPPANVTSITADDHNYVTVTFGNGFYVFNQAGETVEDGGGSPFMVDDKNAVIFPPAS